MTQFLPLPTLDHVVINVRDQIDEGEETFRRLGFTLTPRGYHSLGSMNHLAIFGTDYLELIAAPTGDTRRPEILGSPEGLNGLVFGTQDSASVHAALSEAGVPVLEPREFSRPVTIANGARDAVFRTVRLAEDGTVPDGRLYFCHHLTPDLVWRDEWRQHANGAVAVVRAVIMAHDPARWGALFARMFGVEAVHAIDNGCALTVGLSTFEVVTPDRLVAMFGDAVPNPVGRSDMMAGLSFRTLSLDQAESALDAGGIAGFRREKGRILVPAAAAFEAVLEFVA